MTRRNKVLIFSATGVAALTLIGLGYRYTIVSERLKYICSPINQTVVYGQLVPVGKSTPLNVAADKTYWIKGSNEDQTAFIFGSLSYPSLYYSEDKEQLSPKVSDKFVTYDAEDLPLYKSENYYKFDAGQGQWQLAASGRESTQTYIQVVSCPKVTAKELFFSSDKY